MRIELNIGLNVDGIATTAVQQLGRIDQALSLFGMRVTYSRLYTTHYMDASGQEVTEPGLFLAIDSNNLFAVLVDVYYVASALQQECIDVYIPQKDLGMLIGPKSCKWGDFQLDFFKRCAEEPQRLAA